MTVSSPPYEWITVGDGIAVRADKIDCVNLSGRMLILYMEGVGTGITVRKPYVSSVLLALGKLGLNLPSTTTETATTGSGQDAPE